MAPASGKGEFLGFQEVTLVSGGTLTLSGSYSSVTSTLPDFSTLSHTLKVGDIITLTGGPGTGEYVYLGAITGSDAIYVRSLTSPFTKYVLNDSFVSIPVTFTGTDYAYCLLAGTLVATPSGTERVEYLGIGDLVLTADGRTVPIRWIGRQVRSGDAVGIDAVPVTISAGALGENQPVEDLHVSPDHAVLVGGFLVTAEALMDGVTIKRMAEERESISYYHLEFDAPELIIANGAVVESFVDSVSRQAFDNYDEWVALGLPGQAEGEALPLRVKSARQLPPSVVEIMAARRQELGAGALAS